MMKEYLSGAPQKDFYYLWFSFFGHHSQVILQMSHPAIFPESSYYFLRLLWLQVPAQRVGGDYFCIAVTAL